MDMRHHGAKARGDFLDLSLAYLASPKPHDGDSATPIGPRRQLLLEPVDRPNALASARSRHSC